MVGVGWILLGIDVATRRLDPGSTCRVVGQTSRATPIAISQSDHAT